MTDNRTTELLRKLLDERGVEYKSHYLNTSWYAGMKLYMATDDAGGTLTVDNLTPEQAIAATLRSDAKPCYAAEENYKRCKYGTNRGWCDDAPFLVWDDTGHLFVTMGGLKTWDVTDDAKTWFATLGGGECKWVWVESWTDTTDGRECDYAHWMPDCGCWSEYDHRFSDFDDYAEKPTGIAFCERCGKAVKR